MVPSLSKSCRFKHPHSGEEVDFSCPPPADFSELFDNLQCLSSVLTLTKSASVGSE